MSDAAAQSDRPTGSEPTAESTEDDDLPRLDATSYTTLESNLPPDRHRLHARSEHWEAVGRTVLARRLERHLADLRVEVGETVCASESGSSVNSDHVAHLREAIAALERTVETRLAPLADDVEPWERTADRVPAGRLHEALDLDPDDLHALRNRKAN